MFTHGDKERSIIQVNAFETPHEDGGEREGGKMKKGDIFMWILIIGLGIFAIASFFIYVRTLRM